MNSSIYIFGNMQTGYTQYPDDETTHEIFQNYALNAKAPTQLAIHRDGTLMYYGYLRMLEGEQYIGLCVILNNVMLTNISVLFSLFEHTIALMAELGFLIKFGTDGSLMGNTEHLYMSPEEVRYVTEQLRNAFESQKTVPIPPTNYSIPSDSVGKFTVKDATGNILYSAYTNGYTYVYKSEGYNTVTMDSYQGVLAAVNDENESLKQQIDALKGASKSSHVDKSGGAEKNLLRGIVVVFAIILIGGGIFAYQQVKDKQEQINQTQERLKDLEIQEIVRPTSQKSSTKHESVEYSRFDNTESHSTTENYLTVEITGKDLRMRLGPSTSYNALQYPDKYNIHPTKGDYLELLGEEYDFYKVRYKGNIVYVSKDFATPSYSPPYIQPPTIVVITGQNVLMRTGPDVDYSIVTDYNGYYITLKKWSTYTYIETVGDYYKINYYGSFFYVSKFESHPV